MTESNDDRDAIARMLRVGLCASCVHARLIDHPRGGEPYWRCGMADVDKSYPKYPRLPVIVCDGYEEGAPQRKGAE